MRIIYLIGLSLSLLALNVNADGNLYSLLSDISLVKEKYEVVKTPTGIDLNSKDKFKNTKGKIEPVTHLMLEGPLRYKQIQNMEQAVYATANVVRPEVDIKYKNQKELYSGLGVDIVDINGTKVGIINYKMNREPKTYVRRAVTYTANGLYTFSIVMHKSKPKDKAGMLLEALLIAAVNSGKL